MSSIDEQKTAFRLSADRLKAAKARLQAVSRDKMNAEAEVQSAKDRYDRDAETLAITAAADIIADVPADSGGVSDV